MTKEPKYNPDFLKKRWIGYFDLLGTKNLIKSKSIISVFLVYKKAIEKAAKSLDRTPKVDSAWFSDTFLLFTEEGEGEEFAEIDHVSRWFVYYLVTSQIPVRGAISFGDFYADKPNSLYFGQGLVEAYEYGEAQDWIGFLLCPSAVIKLDLMKLPANERLNYAYWPIPFKTQFNTISKELPACILGQWLIHNGKNQCLEKISEMKDRINQEGIVRKYQNTIDFIKKSERRPTEEG